MTTPNLAQIKAAIDPAETLDLLREAVRTESVTGNEDGFAKLLAKRLEPCADLVCTSEVEPGRPLVWSHTRGRGLGPTVLIVGHLDTVAPSAPPLAAASDEGGAVLAHGELWGLGAADDKGGIVAALVALAVMANLGTRPAGDVVTLWVPDEESGQPGHGRSIGMIRAVELIEDGTIPRPDLAIYVEPTSLDVYAAQVGFLIGNVEVTGRAAYWARPSEGVDAGAVVERIAASLRELDDELTKRTPHPLTGTSVLTITGMHSGEETVALPGTARLSFIRSAAPGEDLDSAETEIREAITRAVAGTGATAEVLFPDGRDHESGGHSAEADSTYAPITGLCDSLRTVRPQAGKIGGADYWSENSILGQIGIPAVYCGPGSIDVCHTRFERVEVAQVHDLALAFALYLLTPADARS